MTKTKLEQFVEDEANIHLKGSIREDFEELFPKDQEASKGMRPSKSNRAAALVLWGLFAHAIRESIKYTAKAFGGCTTCFGKGYSTEQTGNGEIKMHFCSDCNRGTELSSRWPRKHDSVEMY